MNSRYSSGRMFVSVVLAVLAHSVGRTAEIVVGDHELQPNATEQVIRIPISGGEPISGLDLFVQVGDGRPELQNLGLPRGSVGPKISKKESLKSKLREI